MYKRIIFFYLIIFILLSIHGKSQQWIRIFTGDTNFQGYRIIESYDKGYLIAGDKELSTMHCSGWVVKTDINGFRLWEKSLGDSLGWTAFSSITMSGNGEITLIGDIAINGFFGPHDPFIVKLNPCGEKQWCKIYDAPNPYGYGYDIISVPGGEYMALFINWVNWVPGDLDKPVWLFRLDENGDIIWQQYYPQDSIFWGTTVFRINWAPDSTVVLTGHSYTPNPVQAGPVWLRPLIAKVDTDGNSVFELSWGRTSYLVGTAYSSIQDLKGNIFTAGDFARPSPPYGVSPCLLKTSTNGNEIFNKALKDSTESSGAGVLAWFQDSTMIINGVWKGLSAGDTSINGVFKTDTLGNIILENELFWSDRGFMDCISTFDNKVLMVGPFINFPYFQTIMVKLNSNLEYDSAYTRPFTYDSLCPYPIASDTILLDDCEVVVDIDEPIKNPEKTELKIFPNPASQKTTIELPEYLVRVSGGFGFSATTIYHQWKDVRLEVFDLFGKLIFSETVPQHKNSVSLHVSSWSPGMYLARIVFMNEVVAREKFVIN
jgi:hypothetical protein